MPMPSDEMIVAAGVLSYLIMMVLAYAGTLAFFWGETTPTVPRQLTHLRELRALALLVALLPAGPLLTPFLTGFYMHGLRW